MRKLYGKRRSKATAEGTWEKVDKDGDLALVISSSLLDGQEGPSLHSLTRNKEQYQSADNWG